MIRSNEVFFVNRVYWPDGAATAQLLTDLAQDLARRGWNVTVVSSQPAASQLPRDAIHNGVRIIRVANLLPGGITPVRKAANFISFWLQALYVVCARVRRNSSLLVMSDPPLLGVALTVVAALRHARIIHWIQDIYPEVAVAVTGQRWLLAAQPIRNWAWCSSDLCVTVGEDMASVVVRAGVDRDRVRVVPNWAPQGASAETATRADVAAIRSELGPPDTFVVAYAGNLGRVHDLHTVIDCAVKLRADATIRFVFQGGGPQRRQIERRVAELRLQNVLFVPPQPREKLAASLVAADVHLVTLRPGCQHYVFPSKLYGIAAAERPLIYVGPLHCEIAHLVESRGLGIAVESGNAEDLANAIVTLRDNASTRKTMGANAAKFFETAPDPLSKWELLLRSLQEQSH